MKRTLLLIGLGAAFLAVSLWVTLSGGRSARAIRTKYRLGGAILSLTAALSLASCENGNGPFTTCYDPVTGFNRIEAPETLSSSELRNGDIVRFDVWGEFETTVKISLIAAGGLELQSESYELKPYEDREILFTIAAGEYRGAATLRLEYDEHLIGTNVTPVSRDIDVIITNEFVDFHVSTIICSKCYRTV